MNERSLRDRHRLPPTAALIAFESAARHQNFSQAARELGTFQSAVSRQIATLERATSLRLFERSSTGVILTRAGRHLHEAVAAALGQIRRGIVEASELPGDEEIVISCAHGASQFIVLPRYNALCERLGEGARVRVTTFDEVTGHLPHNPVPDVFFTWNPAYMSSSEWVRVLAEAVMPVCSPKYAEAHPELLSGPVSGWGDVTLMDYGWPNEGWLSWEDWFDVHGHPSRDPRYVSFDSYAYLLEAAAAGRGIAMGWRFFVESHLASGALIALADGFVEHDHHFICIVTAKGQGNPYARECLRFFEEIEPLALSQL